MEATTVCAKEFAKQLIADKCKRLIESENMLPEKVMAIVKRAHREYNESPTDENFNTIKDLILQTKYVEESVEYKNFNRGTFLIAINLIVNKCQDLFPNYKSFFVNAAKRLEKIDPDMKSSPKDMLKHYYECIEEMENPKVDDHYMVSYAKSICTRILYDCVADMTNVNGSTVNIHAKKLVLNSKNVVPLYKIDQNKKINDDVTKLNKIDVKLNRDDSKFDAKLNTKFENRDDTKFGAKLSESDTKFVNDTKLSESDSNISQNYDNIEQSFDDEPIFVMPLFTFQTNSLQSHHQILNPFHAVV
ncbi:hypothetical protein [Phthorimaea operculella granulovirus]|uniref:Uncharacterized protein n=1 Tax=Phthorimaea operculella granulovirus TaxID=192584 RepID=Q8JS12_9BBAC|nr:hypothetical protein [Phthorimaea operculella granulovirus]AAM70245.1 hypothetical protein [Phthorimaea operculella granulovirus]ANY57436.1 hypothetical protein PhopGVgp047 [Phthorimaea operculella granulovirus]QBH65882.1 hypothetical protein PhopGVgp047 [Phthorimaea operculella granulovirus]QBH66012.1 hypothetical protein PhopGVgp047 [Phthorimaea operculella granulovirus]QBH66142.1 hypothetical protein PhopGVgp047 [Phthorimaea operculella granulovirus]